MDDAKSQAQQDADLEAAFARVTTPAERKRAFMILFLSLVCMGAGQTVLYAILPPAARELHLSALQMTSVVSVSALIWVFSSTYWGLKSDKWGRKPVMLLGLVAFGVSFALLAGVLELGLRHLIPVVFVFPVMVAMRSIYGTFGSGTSPAAQAYVADRTTKEERLQGIATINAAFSLGTALGPGIVVLSAIDLLAPFYFVSALALGSAAMIWFLLPERTAPKSHARQLKSSLRWYDKRILPFVMFTVGLSLVGTIPVQTMGFFFIDVLHVAAKEFHPVHHGGPDRVGHVGVGRPIACGAAARSFGAPTHRLGVRGHHFGLCDFPHRRPIRAAGVRAGADRFRFRHGAPGVHICCIACGHLERTGRGCGHIERCFGHRLHCGPAGRRDV